MKMKNKLFHTVLFLQKNLEEIGKNYCTLLFFLDI